MKIEDIEKTIYRCFGNYWNTRESKSFNLGRVSKIAAQDVMKLIEQENTQLLAAMQREAKLREALEWIRTETAPPTHGTMADIPTINACWEVAEKALRCEYRDNDE